MVASEQDTYRVATRNLKSIVINYEFEIVTFVGNEYTNNTDALTASEVVDKLHSYQSGGCGSYPCYLTYAVGAGVSYGVAEVGSAWSGTEIFALILTASPPPRQSPSSTLGDERG